MDTNVHARSVTYLANILNALADPIFVKDENHAFCLFNTAFANLIGKPEEDILGKSDFDFFPKEQAEVFWAKDEAVYKTGSENVNEELITDKTGKVRTIVTKKSLFMGDDGKRYLVGVILDITGIREAEKALRARTEELQKINALMVDREIKMIEMKREMDKLRAQISTKGE